MVGALDAGADDYVIKPFGGGQLDARIRAVLRRLGPDAKEPADSHLVAAPEPPLNFKAYDGKASFDGRAVAGPEPDDFLWKGISAAEEGKRTPKVEVLRGGEKVVLYLPAEFPVIVGLPVRRKE